MRDARFDLPPSRNSTGPFMTSFTIAASIRSFRLPRLCGLARWLFVSDFIEKMTR